ncbi:SENSITIVE TO UV 2-like protein [Drosera capensis]
MSLEVLLQALKEVIYLLRVPSTIICLWSRNINPRRSGGERPSSIDLPPLHEAHHAPPRGPSCESDAPPIELQDRETCLVRRQSQEEPKHLSKKLFDMTKSIAGRDGEDNSMVPVRSENQNTLSRNVNLQTKARRTIGIQTDEDEDCAGPAPMDDVLLASDLQKRLLTVWSSKSKNSGKSFVAKLLEKCSSEFCALFSFSGSNMISGMLKIPDLLHSSETSKVSKLYAVLTEVGDDAVPLQALLEVLLSLCSLQNVIVVHRSLQILHAVLDLLLPTGKSCSGSNDLGQSFFLIFVIAVSYAVHLLATICHFLMASKLRRKLPAFVSFPPLTVPNIIYSHQSSCLNFGLIQSVLLFRDNVKVQGLQIGSRIADSLGFKGAGQDGISSSGLAPLKIGIDTAAFLEDHSGWDFCAPLIISRADVLRVFELMLQIAMSMSGHEHVQVEAVAIMITIVVRTDAYREREKFGDTAVFEAVSVLLKKEAGLRLQEMALHLLYLLLNCPKLLAAFCSGFKDSNSAGAPNAGANTASACLSFGILDGLGMCISCCRNSALGLHLCRRAIVVLAFLASSGKTGFEFLLIHKLPNRANFLGLILRVLVSEADAESSENCTEPAISRERTLLMKEALILLNRLASHPTYAPAVLKVLTSYGDLASLSIDIANRAPQLPKRFPLVKPVNDSCRLSHLMGITVCIFLSSCRSCQNCVVDGMHR